MDGGAAAAPAWRRMRLDVLISGMAALLFRAGQIEVSSLAD
jgi:hypothetical protein